MCIWWSNRGKKSMPLITILGSVCLEIFVPKWDRLSSNFPEAVLNDLGNIYWNLPKRKLLLLPKDYNYHAGNLFHFSSFCCLDVIREQSEESVIRNSNHWRMRIKVIPPGHHWEKQRNSLRVKELCSRSVIMRSTTVISIIWGSRMPWL